MNKRKSAFTLVEMMAVVVIIGILAAVVGPKIFNQVSKSQQVRAKRDIEGIRQAVTMYRFDTNRWPEEMRDLINEPDTVKNWNGPYLEKKAYRDPWDNDYEYRQPGLDGREFDVWSFGEDGQEGGEGMDSDIVSWEVEE